MSEPRDTGDEFSIPEPPPYEAPVGRADPAAGSFGLAEWWQRVVAIIIDGILLFIPMAMLAAAMLDDDDGGFFRADPGYLALTAIVGLLYYGLLNGSEKGQTIGKMAMGIQVRDADTGGPIGYGRGLGRYAIVYILGLPFFFAIPALLDGLWPLWDKRRQALHDKPVNSVVVRAR
jgi:uncharacterized RDD family membrane protein YckC